MTQAFNLAQLANNLNTSGQLDATDGLTGALPIANGGTGQTSANSAFNALVPSQTGNSGKYLSTNGSNTSWATLTQKLLQTVVVYSSNTRVAFSEANVPLTNANDFRYTPSARIGGSITKQSSTSYCLVWAQYAAWVNSSNWHDTYMWEDTTNDARHIGFDVYRMAGPTGVNRTGHTFTQIFTGLGTGTRTFYIAQGSGDSRSNGGVLNYNPETDTGNTDCANQSTWSQVIVMEIEP